MVLIEKGTIDATDGKLSRIYSSSNQRAATITNTGITFGHGMEVATQNDSCAIPTRIWGIKNLTLNQN